MSFVTQSKRSVDNGKPKIGQRMEAAIIRNINHGKIMKNEFEALDSAKKRIEMDMQQRMKFFLKRQHKHGYLSGHDAVETSLSRKKNEFNSAIHDHSQHSRQESKSWFRRVYSDSSIDSKDENHWVKRGKDVTYCSSSEKATATPKYERRYYKSLDSADEIVQCTNYGRDWQHNVTNEKEYELRAVIDSYNQPDFENITSNEDVFIHAKDLRLPSGKLDRKPGISTGKVMLQQNQSCLKTDNFATDGKHLRSSTYTRGDVDLKTDILVTDRKHLRSSTFTKGDAGLTRDELLHETVPFSRNLLNGPSNGRRNLLTKSNEQGIAPTENPGKTYKPLDATCSTQSKYATAMERTANSPNVAVKIRTDQCSKSGVNENFTLAKRWDRIVKSMSDFALPGIEDEWEQFSDYSRHFEKGVCEESLYTQQGCFVTILSKNKSKKK
eukprot:gene12027-2612_t